MECGLILSRLPSESLRSLRSVTIDERRNLCEVNPWDMLPPDLDNLALVFAKSEDDMMDAGFFERDGLKGLFPLLARQTNLTTLTVQGSFMADLHMLYPVRVRLPTLRDLTLSGGFDNMLHFLEAIESPNGIRRIVLDSSEETDKESELDALLTFIQQSSLSTPGEPYTSLGIGRQPGPQMVLAATRASDPSDAVEALFGCTDNCLVVDCESIGDVSLCVLIWDLDNGVHDRLIAALNVLDLTCVRDLQLCDFQITPLDMLRYFSTARAVEKLYLRGQDTNGMIIALGLRVHGGQHTDTDALTTLEPLHGAADMLFPTLGRLYTEDVDFSAQIGTVEPSTLREVFRRTVAVRKQLGNTLEHLVCS